MRNSLTYIKAFLKGVFPVRRPLPLIIGLGILGLIWWYYSAHPVDTVAVLASAVRQSTPLILGALCAIFGERCGVMNIGIEGQMLFSAFVGFMFNVWTGNLLLAVLAGIAAGAALGILLAFMSVTLKIDQIVGGTVINILALGLTGYFYQSGLSTAGKLHALPLGALKNLPLIGPVLCNHPPITYLTILLVFIVHGLLFHTAWGLRTRAVGEHPRADASMGINVFRVRYVNLLVGGAFAGLAGAFLTLEAVGSFERAMTNGRGFVALAIMIFGKWTPLGAWGAALIFGFAIALQTQLQFTDAFQIPHQLIGSLPYLLTVVVLALFVGRTHPPAALGRPYYKE